MNDDLLLLLTCLSVNDELIKIALKIEHGMNHPYWGECYKYYRDPDTFEMYKKLVSGKTVEIKKILGVKEIDSIIY